VRWPEAMSGPLSGTANRKCKRASRNLTSTEIEIDRERKLNDCDGQNDKNIPASPL
jgi:hypothetical protein